MSSPDVRGRARLRVRQGFTDFEQLDRSYGPQYPRVVVRGEGAYLYDDEGRRLLDGCAHLGSCQVGHGRPEIAEAVARQIRQLEFTALEAGITHPLVVELSERLAGLVQVDDPVFVYGSSGSEAVDVAFKIARVYHARRGQAGRTKILARAGSYHGATYGALSANGMPALREPFAPLLPGIVRVAQPSPGRCGYCAPPGACTLACADEIERVIEREGPETVAALIGEPVAIQEAVKVPHPQYWRRIRDTCDRFGALLIVDEVLTGFGRTGRMFGLEHWGIKADLATTAKGLTSGYVPMAMTAVARHVYEHIASPPLAHVNTYAGHPVACAAALVNLDIIERERLVENAQALEEVVRGELAKLGQGHGRVVGGSVLGLLSSLELSASVEEAAGLADAIRHECYERGLALRTAGLPGRVTVYFYPPLVVTEEDILGAFETVNETLGALL